MHPMFHDVIIVGAGPAGSICARACAQEGLKTLLLDGAVFPRRKPCGGAVSQQALALLDSPLPQEIVEQECFGVRVHHGQETIEVRKARWIAVLVDRSRFDHYLALRAAEAGAVFRDGEPAIGVSVANQQASVTTTAGTHSGRFIVGADGANGMVRRSLLPPFGRDEVMATLVGTAEGDPQPGQVCPSDLLEMHFGIAPQGYGWVFRQRGRASVGVMGLAASFPHAKVCFTEYCRSLGVPVTGVTGHIIPLGGPRRRITTERILLAGDAAGFADPFHGEGIAQAIRSGVLAARAVIDAAKGRKDAFKRYEWACDRLIGQEMRIAWTMARSLERHPRLFVEIFFREATALDRYLDIAAGTSDYRRFRRWLLPRLPGHLIRMRAPTVSK